MGRIKNIADNLANKYKTRNPYELCKLLNIPVLFEPLGNIKGLFQNVLGTPIIHLNNSFSKDELKPVLAHELGHALLHKEFNVCFLSNYTFCITDKYENEANNFAAHLLITDEDLNKFSTGYEYITIGQLSGYFSVPEEFIMYKIRE
ncbi:ImmA/IrrE family metallo-endopeptidase [Faecalimicrobium sp. JNUCC 81]